jgi:hypothetical protein
MEPSPGALLLHHRLGLMATAYKLANAIVRKSSGLPSGAKWIDLQVVPQDQSAAMLAAVKELAARWPSAILDRRSAQRRRGPLTRQPKGSPPKTNSEMK